MKMYELASLFIILVVAMMIYPIYTTIKDCQETKKQEFIDYPPLPCEEYCKDEECTATHVKSKNTKKDKEEMSVWAR